MHFLQEGIRSRRQKINNPLEQDKKMNTGSALIDRSTGQKGKEDARCLKSEEAQ